MDEEQIQPINETEGTSIDVGKADDKPLISPEETNTVDTGESTHTPDTDKSKRKRKPLSCFEVWTIILASIGILVTGATGLAIYWQGRIGSFTLSEIRKQYPELQKSAEAAKTAADIAELSERPWIKIVDVTTRGNNPVIPALSFQGFGYGVFPEGTRQITFQIEISLKNVGHSIADIAVDHELFLPLWDKYFDSILAEQKKFCEQSRLTKSESPAKVVLFPDESFIWRGSSAAFVAQDRINHFGRDRSGGYIIPTEIVCVNYGINPSNRTYQTRALYEVFRHDDRTRFFNVGIDRKARDIFLIREQFADLAF